MPKLSKAHAYPNAFQKLSLKLAVQQPHCESKVSDEGADLRSDARLGFKHYNLLIWSLGPFGINFKAPLQALNCELKPGDSEPSEGGPLQVGRSNHPAFSKADSRIMPRTSLNAGQLPAGVPPSRRPPLLPTPTLPKAPQREQSANSKELPVRILCLDSGQGPPTAPQLRRLLGFPGVVDRVVPGDRCEVAVYENPVSEVHVTLQLERPPKDTFMQMVVKWCDWEITEHVLGGGVDRKCNPPEWWLASEELEERCSPYDAVVAMEHKDVPVEAFALGCLLGYNTFVAHFDSARTTPPGAKTPSSKKPSKSGPPILTKFSKWKKAEPSSRSGCGVSEDPPTPCRKVSCEARRLFTKKGSANSGKTLPEEESPANLTSEEPSSSASPAQPTEGESTQESPAATTAEHTVPESQTQEPVTSTASDSSATAAHTTACSEPFPLFPAAPSSQASTSQPKSSDATGQRRPSAWQGWRTPVVVPVPEPPPEPFRPGPQPAIIQLPTPKKEPKGKWAALLTPSETAEDCGGRNSSTGASSSSPTTFPP
ncbi:hypothetical protein MTO96_006094 [Rhipicephalus appendiculatus]